MSVVQRVWKKNVLLAYLAESAENLSQLLIMTQKSLFVVIFWKYAFDVVINNKGYAFEFFFYEALLRCPDIVQGESFLHYKTDKQYDRLQKVDLISRLITPSTSNLFGVQITLLRSMQKKFSLDKKEIFFSNYLDNYSHRVLLVVHGEFSGRENPFKVAFNQRFTQGATFHKTPIDFLPLHHRKFLRLLVKFYLLSLHYYTQLSKKILNNKISLSGGYYIRFVHQDDEDYFYLHDRETVMAYMVLKRKNR